MLKLVDIVKGEQIAIFNNIGIETAAMCNRHCYFCPNDYFKRHDDYMSWDMIKKIILDLKELNYKGRVEWYIYNEPTRDTRLLEIIAYCREQLPHTCQMINTNGDYFKAPSDILKLFLAGLNQMQINVYSANDGAEDDDKFEKGVRQAKERQTILQKWIDLLSEEQQISQTLSLYQNIGSKKRACQVVAKYGIKKTTKDAELQGPNHFSNRSGNIPDFRATVQEPLNKHCTRPFRFLNINWKGNAILCCNDFYGETHFGNVMEKSLVDIWNDTNFHIYRLKLQNKKRDCFLCHNCDFTGGYYPHMTDHVTFGADADAAILAQDLSDRNLIFEQPVVVTKEQQGVPR